MNQPKPWEANHETQPPHGLRSDDDPQTRPDLGPRAPADGSRQRLRLDPELAGGQHREGEQLCPPGAIGSAAASGLPWASELLDPMPPVTRDETKGVGITVECRKEGTLIGSTTFTGSLRPTVVHGTSALHPGLEEPDAGAGELDAEGSKGTVTAKFECEDKSSGFEEQEVINVKNT